jgi:hypothetical protein
MAICECPNCSKKHNIPDNLIGSNGRCAGCNRVFKLSVEQQRNNVLPHDRLPPPQRYRRNNYDDDDQEEVAPIPGRFGLKLVSTILIFVGGVSFLASSLLLLAAAIDVLNSRQDFTIAVFAGIFPVLVSSIFASMGLIWSGGVLQLGMAIEARVCENTRFLLNHISKTEKK